jgi:hypothetical protein
MKFAYLGGKYKEYRGYVFANGNPADVTDKATIDELSINPLYRRINDAVREEGQGQEAAEEVVDMTTCPKCGKSVTRGRYMHIKNCKGVK